MRYTAAYLLAVLGGNSSPDVAAIAKILGSVGIECDNKRAQKVVDACKGKDVNEIIADGMKKIDEVSLVNTSVVTTTTTNDKTVVNTQKIEPKDDPSPPSTPDDPGFISLFD